MFHKKSIDELVEEEDDKFSTFTEEQQRFVLDNDLISREYIISAAHSMVSGKLRSAKLFGVFVGAMCSPLCIAIVLMVIGSGNPILAFVLGGGVAVSFVWLIDKVIEETTKFFLLRRKK